MSLLEPQWPAPKSVRTLVSTRSGGVSQAPYDSLNLGDHVGDRTGDVLANRVIFTKEMPGEPLWLKQIHRTTVSTPQTRHLNQGMPIEADASVTNTPEEVLVIMTADCLPVLFTNSNGTAIGAAHAGWRGLCAGILENTIAEMLKIAGDSTAADLMAWLGPAIGPQSFEVGEDVVKSFQDSGFPVPTNAFKAIPNKSGKYLADIYLLARGRLEACGMRMIFGGEYCTVRDQQHFFSYRRDGETGRFASAIWIEK
ncbi:peptidoglycan editing factor PgeF [Polynucleobacter sp. AP-Reno-20A-A9]|uniref:peptidoglycan editing factor PgeF n=1 Tax=Polynucleobacter sp. AP-Reno-20A-A9 TaxID=2576925 RepID=UPI001C0D9986|nr:peptidoglycan editing factor PgeF [Polynucleobacter sp. AP-Reno-20A-A9]MBU3628243.1 peptidoglycan editing factor PgeF [Polynucleobacter sp. AP-Reno-20A-A9]